MEQFLEQAESARGPAAVCIIQDVLSHPSIFVFGELLSLPSIQELRHNEYAPHYELLRIFAFGNYISYKDEFCHGGVSQLPDLKPEQRQKLRFLSIVSLAASLKQIPYSHLLGALDITSVRELEDLIIRAIYAGVVSGKLDQKNAQFDVEYAIGRDIPHEMLYDIIGTLRTWSDQCKGALTVTEAIVTHANAHRGTVLANRKDHQAKVAMVANVTLENECVPQGSSDVQPNAKRQKMRTSSPRASDM